MLEIPFRDRTTHSRTGLQFPRRRQLLSLIGLKFTVTAADVDESLFTNRSPSDYVLRLAETKARAIQAGVDQIVLAADTTVVLGSDILGKPKTVTKRRRCSKACAGAPIRSTRGLPFSVPARDCSLRICV